LHPLFRVAVSSAALVAALLAGCSKADTSANSTVTTTAATVNTAAPVTPRLSSVENFRDIAGREGGYRTVDGGTIRAGLIYRSNALVADGGDLAVMNTLGVRTVFDLRSSGEISAKPDRVPEGAKYVRYNVYGDAADSNAAAGGGLDISSVTSVNRLMVDAYQKLVNVPEVRAQLGAAITDIALTDGPVIFNCTSGKDRTGWIAATILTIAGVDRGTVMRDYLLSNEYLARTTDSNAARATESRGPARGDAMRALSSVRPEYLKAGLDEIEKIYGSFDNYVADGLGLSDGTLAALRSKLVVA